MRTFVTLAPVLLILQCVCLAASSVDLIVVSEQTAQGAKLARPTSEHPAYYLAFDAGCLDARAGIGGLKRPAGAAVEQTLRNALRSNGTKATALPKTCGPTCSSPVAPDARAAPDLVSPSASCSPARSEPPWHSIPPERTAPPSASVCRSLPPEWLT